MTEVKYRPTPVMTEVKYRPTPVMKEEVKRRPTPVMTEEVKHCLLLLHARGRGPPPSHIFMQTLHLAMFCICLLASISVPEELSRNELLSGILVSQKL